MNWAALIVLLVLPFLLGATGGYAVGIRRADVVALLLHVLLGGATFTLWFLMARASGWDGITYLLLLVPLGVCWVTYIVAHLIGHTLAR